MLRLLLVLVLLAGLSCSKEPPPTAPAGKKTCDFCDLLDAFQGQSDGDTASDSTASSSPDSSAASSSDSTAASLPDSSVSSPTAAVVIPDAALRRYIEKVLKKNRGATITQADMNTLVNLLNGHGEGIKSLTGLEAATNLQNVAMGFNEISDLTPLANLPKLRYLYLIGNQVSDLTPLAHLPKLRYLNLIGNPLSDASIDEQIPALERRGVEVVPSYLSPPDTVLIPDVTLRISIERVLKKEPRQPISQAEMETLTHLPVSPDYADGLQAKSLIGLEAATNLQELYLQLNAISDVTPLANLVNLQTLNLVGNAISDLTPLVNLPNLRSLNLESNPPLNDASLNEQVPALRRRGVELVLSPYDRTFPDSPFDIELVFLDYFTEDEQEIWHRAARRWEAAIQADMPDFTYPNSYTVDCGDHSVTIPAGERIDDLRVHLTKRSLHGPAGLFLYYASENLDTGRYVDFRCISIDPEYSTRFEDMWYIGLHEIGHALGLVPLPYPPHTDLLSRSNRMIRHRRTAEDHFAGPQAIAAFNQAGGRDYQGPKVPTRQGGSHWDSDVLAGELMTLRGGGALSAITLGALSDLGYTVDFSAADPYQLPSPGAAKPVADAVPFCSVEMKMMPAPVYVDD